MRTASNLMVFEMAFTLAYLDEPDQDAALADIIDTAHPNCKRAAIAFAAEVRALLADKDFPR
jgi:hypothetical protein